VLDTFDDGVWFIDLAPLTDPALAPLTIAAVLGVRAEPGRPLTATLQDWLRPRQLLLILDNCEHLIDACANFSDAVLHASRETCILATSREALGIAGELAWRVPSLQIPNPAEFVGAGLAPAPSRAPAAGHAPAQAGQGQALPLQGYASVRLFVERAKFANPSFALTDANAPAVAQICYRLDGIPLAIELAAARVKAMRVEQIAERLDDRFRLLTGGRTALPRHQTLRSLLDWSHDLLTEPERVLLRRLSVFAGGWTLAAAEAVCSSQNSVASSQTVDPSASSGQARQRRTDGGKENNLTTDDWLLATDHVLDLLTHLVEKSLVLLDEQATEPRYHMLETIRQYAHERLIEAGENERLGDQHLAFFQRLAERAEAPLQSAQRGQWMPRLEVELDNLRAALDWGCAHDLESARLLAGQLSWFWYSADHLNEARTWYERVLRPGEGVTETKGMAFALFGAGWIAGFLYALDDAERLLERSVALWRVLADKAKVAQSVPILGFVKIVQGDSESACALYEANESAMRQFVGAADLAWALTWWGVAVATARADYAAARLLHEESLALGLKLKASNPLFNAYGNLAKLATLQGDYALARQYMLEGVTWSRIDGTRGILALALGQLADVAYLQSDYAEARTLYDEALASIKAVGDRAHAAHMAIGLGYLAVRQGELEQAEAIFAECMDILHKGQFQLDMARCLAGYADLRLAQGHVEHAVRLLASEVVYSQSRSTHIPIDRIRYERTLAAARAQLDEAAFNAAWDAGRKLTLEQAFAEAGQVTITLQTPPRDLMPRDPNALTVREREVLRLVATGLSDAQIAAQLVISRRTVQTHLTSIFGKFGVNSRSAAAHHALSHKLL
jgi:non-specific serine/threonine protein kinase